MEAFVNGKKSPASFRPATRTVKRGVFAADAPAKEAPARLTVAGR